MNHLIVAFFVYLYALHLVKQEREEFHAPLAGMPLWCAGVAAGCSLAGEVIGWMLKGAQ